MSTTTATEAQEFDAAHRDLMSIAYGIALGALGGHAVDARMREKFTAARARCDRAEQALWGAA